MDATDDRNPSPWHRGERRLQAVVGEEARLAELGRRVIRDHMPEQHRLFFAQLPFVVAGTVDEAGLPWAGFLMGVPGFLTSPDSRTLSIACRRDPGDPLWRGIRDGAAIALLGIELHTRRRNRLNGSVGQHGPGGFQVRVEHSFGNCPRYIRPRLYAAAPDAIGTPAGGVESLGGLDTKARRLIGRADTFFVASYLDEAGDPPHRQMDVSHRGGEPGFVRVTDDGALTIPDYAGNRFFNTLGNIVANPRAGLAFVDFASGVVLQLSGAAQVITSAPEVAAFPGAERLWTVRPSCVVRRTGAMPLYTSSAGASGTSPARSGPRGGGLLSAGPAEPVQSGAPPPRPGTPRRYGASAWPSAARATASTFSALTRVS